MDQKVETIDFGDFGFRIEIGNQQNQLPGAGTFDKTLFEEFKKDFKNQLIQKPQKTAKYDVLEGEDKRIVFEDLYFKAQGFDYACEIDQDFHKQIWSEEKQRYQYTPVYEILREAAYFECQDKSHILLRFGYKNNKENKEQMKHKFKIFLVDLNSTNGPVYQTLKKLYSEWKTPLVVFVDYPNENEHISLHKSMGSSLQHFVVQIPVKWRIEKEVYFEGCLDLTVDLKIFSYSKDKAESAAGVEQKRIMIEHEEDLFIKLDGLKKEFNKLLVTDLKRKQFSDLIKTFGSDYKKFYNGNNA